MAPFRIPFAGRKGLAISAATETNQNIRPGSDPRRCSRDSLALGMKKSQEQANEYKMSLVDDSGVYLPPSPTEKKNFCHRTPTSTTSSNHRSFLSDNEPFSISRESFDSYRRSFDVSGRSPIRQTDSFPSRASLDALSPRSFRSAGERGAVETPATSDSTQAEDEFREVPLYDEPRPKRKSLLSRRGDSSSDGNASASDPANSRFALHLPGRRRPQSGQGDELATMARAESFRSKADVPVL